MGCLDSFSVGGNKRGNSLGGMRRMCSLCQKWGGVDVFALFRRGMGVKFTCSLSRREDDED